MSEVSNRGHRIDVGRVVIKASVILSNVLNCVKLAYNLQPTAESECALFC